MQMIFRSGVFAAFVAALASGATAQQLPDQETRTTTTLTDRNVNGRVSATEQTVEHRTQTNEGEHVDIDVYSPSIEAGRLSLLRRIRRLTTRTSDGSRIVEETEERNDAEPSGPMRLVRRSVTTVRRTGPDSSTTERQIFERDANGRLMPIRSEIEMTGR